MLRTVALKRNSEARNYLSPDFFRGSRKLGARELATEKYATANCFNLEWAKEKAMEGGPFSRPFLASDNGNLYVVYFPFRAYFLFFRDSEFFYTILM